MRGSGLHHSTGWPGAVPGKDAPAVGLFQARRRDAPAGGHQAGGLFARTHAPGGWAAAGWSVVDPGQHGGADGSGLALGRVGPGQLPPQEGLFQRPHARALGVVGTRRRGRLRCSPSTAGWWPCSTHAGRHLARVAGVHAVVARAGGEQHRRHAHARMSRSGRGCSAGSSPIAQAGRGRRTRPSTRRRPAAGGSAACPAAAPGRPRRRTARDAAASPRPPAARRCCRPGCPGAAAA